MNMKHIIISALSLTLLLAGACGSRAKKDYSKEVDEGTFNGNTYTSQALGWTMEFPDNWIITTKSSLESLDERSKESVNDSTSNMSGIKRTLAFQKNFDNNFQSCWETFSSDEAAYKHVLYNNHKMIYTNYLERNIYADTVDGTLKIDGVTFDTYEVSLNRDSKVFATQLLLNALIKGKYMTVTIAYNNNADKKKMLDLFKKSTFK